MAKINVIRPCVVHIGGNEYKLEPGIHDVPDHVAATAVGHGLAEMVVDVDVSVAVPEPEPEPPPVVEEAPDKALHLLGTRRKSTSRRRKG